MRRNDLVLGSLFIGCLVFLFYPGLFFSQVPAFRDAYHFYYPQAVWLDECAQRGEFFPSWNASEGLGVSVAGQPSSALFYPLRALWLLPWLSVAQRFSLVIVVHLWLAAAGVRFAARRLKVSDDAAWLAGISYSLSCPVVFQHSNLIYLCSASWLGFALGALLRWLSADAAHNTRSCLWFAAACSLMVLAGDPHTAVNTFIVASLGILWQTASNLGRVPAENVSTVRQPLAIGLRSSAWLLAAMLMVTITTAIQWIPALRWSQHSQRLNAPLDTLNHTAPELDAVFSSAEAPVPRIYDFSLSPWHVATGVWPTLGGNYLPLNSRWFSAIPGEGRMWVPSLYGGCLPGLLALASLFHKRTASAVWLLALALFSLLAAFGNYSPIWLIREVLNDIGLGWLSQSLPRDHVSSVYWLLTKLVPGYDVFRYPAKWSVWFSAAWCLLAGLQWDRYAGNLHKLLTKRANLLLLGLSSLGACLAISLWIAAATSYSAELDHWLTRSSADAWFGAPVTRDIATSLLIAFSVPLVMLLVVFRVGRNRPLWLVSLTLIEMTVCASQWICFVSAPKLSLHVNTMVEMPPHAWANSSRANFQQDHFARPGSTFASDQADYQRVFLLGKLATLFGVNNLGATQSIETSESVAMRSWLMRHDRLTADQPELDKVLRALGVTHRLTRVQTPGRRSEFTWQALQDPRELCELQVEPSAQRDKIKQSVGWRWLECDVLQIQVDTTQSCSLIVRQFNDGGWKATDIGGNSLSIEDSSLWIDLKLPAGDYLMHLERKWLW